MSLVRGTQVDIETKRGEANIPRGEPVVSRNYYEKPSHKFSSNGASAAAGSSSSSATASAAAAVSHSHALKTYVTEPGCAGNRNAALHHGPLSTDAKAVQEADTTRMQMKLDQFKRQFTPQQ
ncbi:hypothetical protein PG985_013823 [Apiospora marii]|uniref:Uncharacterized protein n=1 Tax=Apiospora marii TaxID=335849 RepID=A0ABR1R6V5_9PEZI